MPRAPFKRRRGRNVVWDDDLQDIMNALTAVAAFLPRSGRHSRRSDRRAQPGQRLACRERPNDLDKTAPNRACARSAAKGVVRDHAVPCPSRRRQRTAAARSGPTVIALSKMIAAIAAANAPHPMGISLVDRSCRMAATISNPAESITPASMSRSIKARKSILRSFFRRFAAP